MPVCTQPHKCFRKKTPARKRPQEREPGLTRPALNQNEAKNGLKKGNRAATIKTVLLQKESGLENLELEAQPPLDKLQGLLAFKMNDEETEAAKQLFERLKNKRIRIKESFYKLLTNVNRENLPTFCAKAAIFFGFLTASITRFYSFS